MRVCSKDLGAGAITPYHNRPGVATRDILAGQELFTNYGEAYFLTRRHEYGLIPLLDNYERAAKLLIRIVTIWMVVCQY